MSDEPINVAPNGAEDVITQAKDRLVAILQTVKVEGYPLEVSRYRPAAVNPPFAFIEAADGYVTKGPNPFTITVRLRAYFGVPARNNESALQLMDQTIANIALAMKINRYGFLNAGQPGQFEDQSQTLASFFEVEKTIDLTENKT